MQDLATTALQVGDKVEALVEGDSLYYGGTLRDIQPDGRKGVVEYDDGDVQTIPMAWILPDERTILYDGGEARDLCPGRERLWAGRSRAPFTVLSSFDSLTLRCLWCPASDPGNRWSDEHRTDRRGAPFPSLCP